MPERSRRRGRAGVHRGRRRGSRTRATTASSRPTRRGCSRACPTTAEDLGLDVAAGTGHVVARAGARVRVVVAVDATAAMLDRGKAEADQAGLRNVVFQRGDAAALPFADGSFDVVVSRFALHHFEDPAVPLREMARCLRAGGTLAVGDLLADADPASPRRRTGSSACATPRIRACCPPPSSPRCSPPRASTPAAPETRDVERPLEPWLAQTHTAEDVAGAIRAALRAELAGGGPSPASGRASTTASSGSRTGSRRSSAEGHPEALAQARNRPEVELEAVPRERADAAAGLGRAGDGARARRVDGALARPTVRRARRTSVRGLRPPSGARARRPGARLRTWDRLDREGLDDAAAAALMTEAVGGTGG